MRAIHHWIDGKATPGTSGRTADVFNPATGEVQARVDLASRAEIDAIWADTALAGTQALPLSMLVFKRQRLEANEAVAQLKRQREQRKDWIQGELAER